VMNALVGCLIPSNRYGTAYGLTSSMASLGMACGPLCSGYMASWWGYRTPFLFIGSFITLISVPLIGLGFRTKETTAPVHPEGPPSLPRS
jgi:MFS family permease